MSSQSYGFNIKLISPIVGTAAKDVGTETYYMYTKFKVEICTIWGCPDCPLDHCSYWVPEDGS